MSAFDVHKMVSTKWGDLPGVKQPLVLAHLKALIEEAERGGATNRARVRVEDGAVEIIWS